MIISEKHRYIFVAVPKTGTTSIQSFLLHNDRTACKNFIKIDGDSYKFSEHNTAHEIMNKLGDKYREFQVIGFIRHPYSRIVSSYHFYRQNVIKSNLKKGFFRKMIRIGFSKLVPFEIWALIYPYKSNMEYFLDDKGNIIVDHIGIFENLKEDFSSIINLIGLKMNTSNLPRINVSEHDEFKSYFASKFFRKLILYKIKDDLDFYRSYSSL